MIRYIIFALLAIGMTTVTALLIFAMMSLFSANIAMEDEKEQH